MRWGGRAGRGGWLGLLGFGEIKGTSGVHRKAWGDGRLAGAEGFSDPAEPLQLPLPPHATELPPISQTTPGTGFIGSGSLTEVNWEVGGTRWNWECLAIQLVRFSRIRATEGQG